jgi:hypothetical protein
LPAPALRIDVCFRVKYTQKFKTQKTPPKAGLQFGL